MSDETIIYARKYCNCIQPERNKYPNEHCCEKTNLKCGLKINNECIVSGKGEFYSSSVIDKEYIDKVMKRMKEDGVKKDTLEKVMSLLIEMKLTGDK